MKKQLFQILFLLVFSLESNAQVSTGANNTSFPTTDYVGWIILLLMRFDLNTKETMGWNSTPTPEPELSGLRK